MPMSLFPQLTYTTTKEAKEEWRPSGHVRRDLEFEQEGR